MTGRLRNLRSFWSGNGPLVSEIERDNLYALADRDKAQRRADALAAELVAVTGELSVRLAEVEEERDELAKGLIVAAERNHTFRLMLAASLDQAYRNCLALSERNAELRREKEDLEREVARLQGRTTEPDWTGTPGWPR